MPVVANVDIACGVGDGAASNGAGMASDSNTLLSDRIMRSEPLRIVHFDRWLCWSFQGEMGLLQKARLAGKGMRWYCYHILKFILSCKIRICRRENIQKVTKVYVGQLDR